MYDKTNFDYRIIVLKFSWCDKYSGKEIHDHRFAWTFIKLCTTYMYMLVPNTKFYWMNIRFYILLAIREIWLRRKNIERIDILSDYASRRSARGIR